MGFIRGTSSPETEAQIGNHGIEASVGPEDLRYNLVISIDCC